MPKPIRIDFKQHASYVPIPDGKGHWLSMGVAQLYSHRISKNITVPIHTMNDLASIPRPIRSIYSVNGPHRIAAIYHDYLYQVGGDLGDVKLTREECDLLFFDIMSVHKSDYFYSLPKAVFNHCAINVSFLGYKPLVSPHVAWSMYKGVRIGGKSSFNK